MKLIQKPSPNHSVRTGRAPDMIVNHITAGDTASSALNWLTNPSSGVSAHFVVDKDGTVYQLVSLERMAWANGTNTAPGDSRYYGYSSLSTVRQRGGNANSYTVSIEHVNRGGGALTDAQLAASVELHRHIFSELKRIYGVTVPIDRQHIVGHCELVPKWKPGCPGASFPYNKIIQGLLNAPVRSDTTDDVTIKSGARYTCKLTAPVKPDFTVGDGGVLKTQFIRSQNVDEFLFSVVATGKAGDGTGVYANGKRIFGVKIT